MGENTKIEWTQRIRPDGTRIPGHTFNGWWGCHKVSPACRGCYAESWSSRFGEELWGLDAKRRVMKDQTWHNPFKWDRAAEKAGERHFVFAFSMADVFEVRSDLDDPLARFFSVMRQTHNLDWLLLTKRPATILDRIKAALDWIEKFEIYGIAAPMLRDWLEGRPPKNMFLGTTVENEDYSSRIRAILDVPAMVHWLSVEPMLGSLNIKPWVSDGTSKGVDWVVAGGESGDRARPLDPVDVRSLRDDCVKHGIKFHFKQWGEYCPTMDDKEGGIDHWLQNGQRATFDLRSCDLHRENEMRVILPSGIGAVRVGKKDAGRRLDGVEWNESPTPPLETSGIPRLF